MKTFFSIIIAFIINSTTYYSLTAEIYYPTKISTIAQQDTNRYLLDNIIAKKGNFQHQRLSVLLKEVHLIVKSYTFIRGSKPGAPIKGIYLNFENSNIISRKIENRNSFPSLVVSFEDPITLNRASELMIKSHGEWLDAEKEFYGNLLVKEVNLVRDK